jgi:glycosyltransferase involved in cell wall biosynthesis
MVPKISIVMPVYNSDRYISTAIESILNQTFSDFELLIWDDGSTDRSRELADQYAELDSRVRVIRKPHCGLAPSLKAAFSATTGAYIGSVDSDDVLAPTALQETMAILDAQPDVGLVYTNYQVINEQGHDLGLGHRCHIPYSIDRLLIDFMTFHFRLIRRSVYEQVGGINAAFERAEDYDLCLRLAEVTTVYHLQRSLYYYRRHSKNLTNQKLEIIYWAYKASSQAIRRRGLNKQYKLTLNHKGQFVLWQHKKRAKSYS